MNKTCTKCGRDLLATTEFFGLRKDRPCGFKSECRACERTRTAAYRKAHPEQVRAGKNAYYAAHREEQVVRASRYYAANRDEQLQHRAAHRSSHREEIRGRQRVYHAAHREECNARCTAYRETHREEARVRDVAYRRAHRGERVAWQAAFYRAHRERYLSYARSYRAREYWCRTALGDSYHIDHVIPLIRGGFDGPENLVVSCPFCNLSKGAKFPHEFSDRLC